MVVTKNLTKIFASGNKQVIALNEVTLNIKRGDFILIKGKSGCGKSTLLFTLGGMLIPSDGFVNVSGQDIYALSESQRTRYRAKNIGFVFQSYYLFPYLSVLENMMMPGRVNKTAFSQSEVEQFAKELNIADRLQHKPAELSMGEKQRVALARAMITRPQLILADEPTGNLDPLNALEVLKHLHCFNKSGGTVVMVTHGNEADPFASGIVNMDKGKIIDNQAG